MIAVGLYEEHNSGYAALADGEILAYAEIERLTRSKNQAGWFPRHLRALFETLPLGEVSAVCAPRPVAVAALLDEEFRARRRGAGEVELADGRILLFDQDGLHGDLHVLSMAVLPGLEPGIYGVLVFDAGQPRLGWVELADPLAELPAVELTPLDLGTWYNGEIFADLFGKLFYGSRDLRHCGKLMGLAAWGQTRIEDVDWLAALAGRSFDDDTLVWKGYSAVAAEEVTAAALEWLGDDPRDHRSARTQDFASAAQELFRHRLCSAVSAAFEQLRGEVREAGRDEPRGLLYSGGCALSVVTNRTLREVIGLPVHVAPFAHDASQFVGAAVYATLRAGGRVPLGRGWPGIPDHSVGRIPPRPPAVDGWRATAADPAAVAELLSRGELVALVQGGAEAGPRALGHRSLLADPIDPAMRDRINHEVKMREWYRPFAPALLSDAFPDYFAEPASPCARYMLDSFRLRPSLRPLLASVSSPDGVARPQAVEAATHPWFDHLLREMGRRTGHPVLLSTSLNAPGLPIALDLGQVLADCYNLGIDTVVAGETLLRCEAPSVPRTAAGAARRSMRMGDRP